MQFDLVSLIAGILILSLGGLMMWSHRVTWRMQQQEFVDDLRELRHLQARYRRRMQISGLIAFVGLMIPIADLPVVWQRGPLPATILWCGIGCLCLWIALLAVGDFATTRAHSNATLARLHAHRDQLMSQLDRLRHEADSSDSNSEPHAE